MNSEELIDRVLHDTHRIVRLIGEGGMGAVYEAVHVKLFKKRFAVKVLHAKMAEDDTIYARFQREAMITSELGHPNIVEVLDFYETEQGQPCMVMEFLEGEDLGQRLEQGGPMTPQQVAALVEQVGSALQAVHDKGIIHRDMKPGNILLVGSRGDPIQAKVLDFGISKIQDANTHLTSDNAVMGTPHYMSPEQGEGHVKEVDHRTDIFALGTICYHALSGVLPFSAPSMLGVLRAICDKPHDPIKVHLPELGEDVDHVLNRALAKRKQDRYERVVDFVRELGLALEGKQVGLESVPTVMDDQVSRVTVQASDVQEFEPPPAPEAPSKPVTMVTPDGPGTDPNLMGLPAVDSPAMEPAVAAAAGSVPNRTTLSGSAGESAPAASPPRRGRPLWQVVAAVAAGVVLPLGVFISLQKAQSNEPSPASEEPPVAAAKAAKQRPAAEPRAPEAAKPPAPAPAPRPPAKTAAKSAAPGLAPAGEAKTGSQPEPAATRVEARQVTIKLVLRPKNAAVLLDGAERVDNPLVLKASDSKRTLQVQAKGYHTRKLSRVFAKNQTVRVRLKRKARDRAPFDDLSDEPKKKRPAKDKAPFNDL